MGDELDGELIASLSVALWAEREAMEQLVFRLVEERLVVSSGNTRWLNKADADVRAAIEEFRVSDVLRAAEAEALAAALRLPPDATLSQLAEAADEPWASVFIDHRSGLRALSFEVQAVADENRRLLDAGASSIRETLAHLQSAVRTYDARGGAVSTGSGPILLDEQA